jgi:hypothetical protein
VHVGGFVGLETIVVGGLFDHRKEGGLDLFPD